MSGWTLERYRAEIERAKNDYITSIWRGRGCVVRVGDDGLPIGKPLVSIEKLNKS